VSESKDPSSAEVLPISVVIPVRNRPAELRAAIHSVLNQEPFRAAEIVVVDDASDDETPEVAEELGARVIRLSERVGPGEARNRGVEAAGFGWVAFLDADDTWLTGHLSRVWNVRADFALIADSGLGSITNRIYGNAGRRPTELTSPRQVIFPANGVQPSGALVQRDVLIEVGGFAKHGLSEDMDAWIRILEESKGLILPSIGWSYREHEHQTSSDRTAMQASELEVVRRYESRPWFDGELVRWLEARHHWERLVTAVHDRNTRAAAREFAWLLLRPLSTAALLPVVRSRMKLRRHQIARSVQAGSSPAKTGLNR
jgi:glycosyltransferase involved in cell wall biosynthesis